MLVVIEFTLPACITTPQIYHVEPDGAFTQHVQTAAGGAMISWLGKRFWLNVSMYQKQV
jgi:hypothetical protein